MIAADEPLSPLVRIARLGWIEPGAAMDGTEAAALFGSYVGLPAKIVLLPDGRRAQLLAPLSYHQQGGTVWDVPTGSGLDGASIPRLFWSIIGGPFEGRYRDASIVHDHYCDSRTHPWQATHRMFYEAMRCSGVGPTQAKIMYYAVYRFGPRWPDTAATGAEAAAIGPSAAREPTYAEAEVAAADAEAIAAHDLSLAEIETLAEARGNIGETGGAEAAPATPLERARLLVVPGGSGTGDDLEAVAGEAANLPLFVLDHFEKKRIRIIACRGGVTDFEQDLRGVTPRGWEGTGRTWDNVPGTYFDDRRRVVIATIAEGATRVVPTAASRLHGSANLVVHESLHGYDYSLDHELLGEKRFTRARDADLPHLGDYERQEGRAGLEETFAESGARFMADRGPMTADWPNLLGYWQVMPGGGTEAAEATPYEPPVPASADDALGSAELDDAGVIRLDLRAVGPGGAIGHAAFVVTKADPAYSSLHARLFAGSPESAGGGPRKVPFRPLTGP